MFRSPFVWEVQVRREVLEDEITSLYDLPYSVWRELIGRSMVKTAKGRDGRNYRIRTTSVWAMPGSEDIRVVVALETGGLRRRLMRQSFVITPENRITE
jgi:hypothetical protein